MTGPVPTGVRRGRGGEWQLDQHLVEEVHQVRDVLPECQGVARVEPHSRRVGRQRRVLRVLEDPRRDVRRHVPLVLLRVLVVLQVAVVSSLEGPVAVLVPTSPPEWAPRRGRRGGPGPEVEAEAPGTRRAPTPPTPRAGLDREVVVESRGPVPAAPRGSRVSRRAPTPAPRAGRRGRVSRAGAGPLATPPGPRGPPPPLPRPPAASHRHGRGQDGRGVGGAATSHCAGVEWSRRWRRGPGGAGRRGWGVPAGGPGGARGRGGGGGAGGPLGSCRPGPPPPAPRPARPIGPGSRAPAPLAPAPSAPGREGSWAVCGPRGLPVVPGLAGVRTGLPSPRRPLRTGPATAALTYPLPRRPRPGPSPGETIRGRVGRGSARGPEGGRGGRSRLLTPSTQGPAHTPPTPNPTSAWRPLSSPGTSVVLPLPGQGLGPSVHSGLRRLGPTGVGVGSETRPGCDRKTPPLGPSVPSTVGSARRVPGLKVTVLRSWVLRPQSGFPSQVGTQGSLTCVSTTSHL